MFDYKPDSDRSLIARVASIQSLNAFWDNLDRRAAEIHEKVCTLERNNLSPVTGKWSSAICRPIRACCRHPIHAQPALRAHATNANTPSQLY